MTDSHKHGTLYSADYVNHGMCKMKLNEDLIESVGFVTSIKRSMKLSSVMLTFFLQIHVSIMYGICLLYRNSTNCCLLEISLAVCDFRHVQNVYSPLWCLGQLSL